MKKNNYLKIVGISLSFSLGVLLAPLIVACKPNDIKSNNKQEAEGLKKLDIKIQTINIKNLSSHSAVVILKIVNPNSIALNKFELQISKNIKAVGRYDSGSKEIIFEITGLESGTKYNLLDLIINDFKIELKPYSWYFETLANNKDLALIQPNSDPSLAKKNKYKLVDLNAATTATTADIVFSFAKKLDGLEPLILEIINTSDKKVITSSIRAKNNVEQIFSFSNLVPNTNYKILSLKIHNEAIPFESFADFIFVTKVLENSDNKNNYEDSKKEEEPINHDETNNLDSNESNLDDHKTSEPINSNDSTNENLVNNQNTQESKTNLNPTNNVLDPSAKTNESMDDNDSLDQETTTDSNVPNNTNVSNNQDNNSSSSPKQDDVKDKDSYEINNLSFIEITTSSAVLVLDTNAHFSNNYINLTFKINDQDETVNLTTNISNNKLNLTNLTPNTNYNLVALRIGTQEFNLTNSPFVTNFTTLQDTNDSSDSSVEQEKKESETDQESDDQQTESVGPSSNSMIDDFVISSIIYSNITNNAAEIVVNFDKHQLQDTTKNRFSLWLNDQRFESVYLPKSSQLIFRVNGLDKNTDYKIKKISLNDQIINLNTNNLSFKTTNILTNNIQKVYYENITANSAVVYVQLQQPIDVETNLNLYFHKLGSDQKHALSSYERLNGSQYKFTLTNLLPNSQYELDSIYSPQITTFTNDVTKTFTTSSALSTNNQHVDLTDMGSFSVYDENVLKYHQTSPFVISSVNAYRFSDQTKYVLRLVKPTKIKGLITLEQNNKIYYSQYDGNSPAIIITTKEIDTNNINVKFNNQTISLPNVIPINTQITDEAILTSYTPSTQNHNITVYLNNLVDNGIYLLTLKPDINVDDGDLTLVATAQNNRLVFDYADYLNPAYERYVISNLEALSTKQNIRVSEDQFINLNQSNNYPNITKIKIEKDANSNTFYGAINFDWKIDQAPLFVNKYLRLTFVDKQQLQTPPDQFYDIQYHGFHSGGYGYLPRDRQPANIKYVYLRFDEFKNFSFAHLVEQTPYVLHKVELVNKYNLQPVHNFILNNNMFISSNEYTAQTNNDYEVNTFVFGTDFASRQNKTDPAVTSYDDLLTYDRNHNLKTPINFNYQNYLNLNRYYLYATQKFNQVYYYIEKNAPKKRTVNEINFDNGKQVHWGVIVENYEQRKWHESDDRKILTITKNLNNFTNLQSQDDVLMNLNFFASVKPLNLDEWSLNHFSYALSFSYDQLNKAANKTLDNVPIKLVQNWENLYKSINHKVEGNPQYSLTLDDHKLEEIINDRIRAKVVLKNNQITISLIAKKGVMNKDLYIHNLTQTLSTFVDKANTYFSVMSIPKNNQDLIYENQDILDPNIRRFDGYMYTLKNHFEVLDNYNKPNKPKGMEFIVSDWRTINDPVNKIYDDVLLRSVGLNYGSGWLVSKVKPNDPTDNHYYFATNQHVPVYYGESFSAPKPHTSQTDTAYYRVPFGYWNLGADMVWKPWLSKKMDGTDMSSGRFYNGYEEDISFLQYLGQTDLRIFDVDVTPILNYYHEHKNTATDDDSIFKAAEHIYQWINANPNTKFSQQGRYIRPHTFTTFYLSSFPGALTTNAKRNIQMRHNFVGDFLVANFGDFGITESYGFYNVFPGSKSDAWNQLQGGSSGTGVYDANGDFIAIHAGRDAGQSASYILATQRINFVGELNDYNDKSFAYYIQRRHRLYPDKYPMLNVFYIFEKPFNK
ncbi:hypothetical protein OF377_01400 [Ureaplasma sp. ES3154-GEN]|uniref:hypothetical protein n=1 Tax=Ureaplasma sp. ES3154-GEN TaxID=2984844 RepID=UPI0021E779B8|nr:hypothetical protein [Ureaplasma sp. ES3154-GEN]MCV3743543.1 hypothetical protein [Ureaplasma sp. ES3154-GEN]